MQKTLLQQDDVKAFALAGNATITLQSGRTGQYFTYKISKHKDKDYLFFIRLLYGPNNEDNYEYIGCYYSDSEHFIPAKPWKDRANYTWPKSLRVIKFFLEHIDSIPDTLLVFHEGRCGRCGRKLTTPESIKRGLGPECYKEANS